MMRSQFDHEDLRVYQGAIEFVAWWEEVAPSITSNVSACDHLDRASAEASGKRSLNERRQFIDTAYGSSLECAACLDVLAVRQANSKLKIDEGKGVLANVVRMLVAWEGSLDER
ncbi:MAG: four helix bundle protein [Lentisphaerae bacterium]|nr:four helix bundle protein [Lentisphaerota bacterium]